MDQKIHVEITRAAAGRMASRLRDFLSKRKTDLRQSSAYQALAVMLGYRDWNTMSAELSPDEDPYSDEKLDNWKPIVFETPHAALNSNGAIVVAIPSAERLMEAVADVRALLKKDRDQVRHLVLADDLTQWAIEDQDDQDFFTVMPFPPEWRHERLVGVNRLIDLRYSRHIIVPLADTETLSFVADAALSTIDCWCFVVADTYSDALRQLARSDTYVQLGGGASDVSILMWPFEKAAQIRDDGSWRPVLRSKLEAIDAVHRSRWPLHALRQEDFNQALDAVQAAEARTNQWQVTLREANPGKVVFKAEDFAQLTELDEIVQKFAKLESLDALALVEMRALIRLGLGWDEGGAWLSVLGKAHRDVTRSIRTPSEFVGSTPNLSQALIEGLRLAREIAV